MRSTKRTPIAMDNFEDGATMSEWDAIEDSQPKSMLHIAVRTVHHVPFVTGDVASGMSIGQMIDRHLEECAMSGDIVDGFEIEFAPSDWLAFMSAVKHGA